MGKSVYGIVTDNIVSMLEKGVVPWRQPWRSIGGAPKSSRNRAYRGINVFILAVTKMAKGYSSNFWLTYKQATEMGGKVKSGERSTQVIFWSVGKEVKEWDEEKQKTVTRRPFILRYYNVFNLEQTEGVKLTKAMQDEQDAIAAGIAYNPSIDEAEAILASYLARDDAPAFYTSVQDKAYYVPALDEIHIPERGQFATPEGFYYAAFHESGHSTGHASRLNRKGIDGFSHGSYSKEELVAEMTNAFLCAEAGLDSGLQEQNASYIKGWLEAAKGDEKLLIQAAAQAQKAADFILGVTYTEKEDDNE